MAVWTLVLVFSFTIRSAVSKWTELSDAGWSPRSGFKMAVSGGSVIAVGGTSDPSIFYKDGYRMSLSDGRWFPLPFSSPQWSERAEFGLSTLPNGTVVLTGGQGMGVSFNDVWALDASKEDPSWRRLPDAPWKRRMGHAQSTCGENIVISGGASSDISVFITVYSDVWSMAPDGTWTEIPASPWHKRFLHNSACLSDGSLLVAGGHYGFQDFNDVWLLSPVGKWSEVTPTHGFSTRLRFGMVAFEDDSVLVGEGMGKQDFWFTEDVRKPDSWRSLAGEPPFSTRYDYGLVALPRNGTGSPRRALFAGGMLLQSGIHNYNSVYLLEVDDATATSAEVLV